AKDRASRAAVRHAVVVAEATAYARDLVNAPPNVLYPQSFAEAVEQRIAERGLPVEVVVHDERDLTRLGCGGIMGVGQGSARPPRIVEVHYRPAKPVGGQLALVGKGITFDTGGVCLKPAAAMLTMKCDMAGAAAVAAAVLAAAELKLPTAVSGYLCLAENMPGGNAQRPSDIVTMRSGLTVEIIDTDAEGRMVLADGITLAVEGGASAIIDVATLTGACVVALGTRVGGVMGTDDALKAAILASAGRTGEPMWPLPLPEELRSKLDSTVADLQHKGDQYGGALTAGLFLREFAKDADGTAIPWAHLDIAGPAYLTEPPFGHVVKGGTGFAVATLIDVAATWGAR
ncbi:leucyl aminopeptidase, partial [Nostocoides sp.]|uniref:leucyl aminopeptidase n=1 Tax=Nostocoides sp. TaxID=1917966 RepID=UPI003BB0995B